ALQPAGNSIPGPDPAIHGAGVENAVAGVRDASEPAAVGQEPHVTTCFAQGPVDIITARGAASKGRFRSRRASHRRQLPRSRGRARPTGWPLPRTSETGLRTAPYSPPRLGVSLPNAS